MTKKTNDQHKNTDKMENELPKRKTTRLKDFDYSTSGAYFVTVCTQDRMPILSEIVTTNDTDNKTTCEHSLSMVGEGLAPPVSQRHVHPTFQTKLKPCGKIAEEQLNLLSNRYPNVRINDYIIMPDHIHAIIFLHNQTGGVPQGHFLGFQRNPHSTSPSPTLNDVVCAFKSLTSRICKQNFGIERMFQRSFMDHVIRDRDDYETRRKYIYENPLRWYYKKIKEYTDSN